jgi:DNA primase
VAKAFKIGYNERAVKYAPRKGDKPIDEPYYGPAIVLPHFWRKRLVGWQHRWLAPDDERPKWVKKYTNTSDFPKDYTVFALDRAAKVGKPPVVVESVPTVYFLWSLGYPAVGTFGSVINELQVKELRAFQQGVILAPDKGTTEEGKYWKAAGELQKFIPVGWINPHEKLAEKEDLGDLKDTPELVCNSVENASWLFASTRR